jgi:hypothetical protein
MKEDFKILFIFSIIIIMSMMKSMTNEKTKLEPNSNACQAFMNKNATLQKWECSIFDIIQQQQQQLKYRRQQQRPLKSANRTSSKYTVYVCACTIIHSCVDMEEFYLEHDLVDASEYAKLEYVSGENFYTEQCMQGMKALTNEKDKWTCTLQYDRLDSNEFYCKCKHQTETH